MSFNALILFDEDCLVDIIVMTETTKNKYKIETEYRLLLDKM